MVRLIHIALAPLVLTSVACGDAAAPPPDGDTLPVEVEVDAEPADVETVEVEVEVETVDAETVDAPEVDAGPGDGIERLDWSSERGPALETSRLSLGERRLVAVHEGGVVGFSDCQVDVGCDFAWFDRNGAIVNARDDRMAIYATALEPNARWLHVFSAEAVEACGPGPSFPTVVTGTLELVDLATGELAYGEAMRSNVFLDPAFSTQGRWLRAITVADGQCEHAGERWREGAAPFALAAFSDPDFWLSVELADGRWAGWSGARFGVADPRVAGSFVALGERIDDFLIGGGWLHGLDGYGDVTEVIEAMAPDGVRWSLALPPAADYRGLAAWGPAVLACTSGGTERGVRECGVFDVTGAHPRRDLEVRAASVRPALFVDGGAAIVFESLEGEAPVLERLELASGARMKLATGEGVLRPIGAAEAALWQGEDGVWLFGAGEPELLVAGPSAQVLVAPQAPWVPAGAIDLRQRAFATIVSKGAGGEHRLTLFDLRTRRLAIVSERLYFAPHPELPLAADDCGQPWVMRAAGGVGDGLAQGARWAYFAEEPDAGEERSLWVVPIDLSAPPRPLTSAPPERCHAPMASLEGGLIAIAIDDEAGPGRHVVLARP